MLQIVNLNKKFKKFKALDNVNLSIEENEIFGFVGPNGAGKTTTMRIVAGLLTPDSGTVKVDGLDAIKDAKKIKRLIGYMPDFFGAYNNMKAHEYMEYYAGLYGMYGSEAKKRGAQLLDLVNLTDKSDAYVDTMSRGMKQRLCMARCLIHDPKLLILDEPASGLDPRARFEMKEIMKTLKDMKKTVIISSHILPELAQMTTTIGIIENGKIITKGSMEQIMQSMNKKERIKIKVTNDIDKALGLIRENKDTDQITIDENYICFTYNLGEEEFAKFISSICNKGVLVNEIVKETGDLEEVFMEITKSYEELEQAGGENDEN